MPTDAERYVTVADLKVELPYQRQDFGLTETEFDGLLSDILGRESERLEAWLDTIWTTESVTDELSRSEATPERDLLLPKRPVQSVASVETDAEGALTEGTDYAVEDTHLRLLADGAISAWPTAYRSVTVEWTYGYDTTPGPVEEAVIRLARAAVDQIKSDGLSSESLGEGSSYSYRPPREVKADILAGGVGEFDEPSYSGGAYIV